MGPRESILGKQVELTFIMADHRSILMQDNPSNDFETIRFKIVGTVINVIHINKCSVLFYHPIYGRYVQQMFETDNIKLI